MNRKLNFFGIFLLIGVLIFSSGCDILRKDKGKPVTLVVWNLWDDSDTWKGMIDAYVAANAEDKTRPKIKIEYYKRSFEGYERYEQELNNALAAGKGPDIFVVHNDWVARYKDKIAPLDGGSRMARDFERRFVDAVSNDFLINGKIYGISLSVDTLALYYNEDIFKAAGIYDPPKTWDEFKDDVTRLTVLDEKGDIVRAGAAIGTDKNVNRSTDIVNLLMLQSGSTITDQSQRRAIFNEQQRDKDNKPYSAGGMALQFYADFANQAKKIYTWNPTMDYSIDAFYQGRAAMMINFSYHIPTVISKAPKLKFNIAPMPQIAGATMPVNYANYWAMTVSAGSKQQEEAWKFLQYISNPEITKMHLEKTKKPAAHRDLVESQEKGQDLNLAVYAKQALTAKSWYQFDSVSNESIMAEAIRSVVLGRSTAEEASDLAATQITQTMKSAQ